MMRGNVVMKGYFKNPAATEEAFQGGWFHTGDLAVMHPDGYIELRKNIDIEGRPGTDHLFMADHKGTRYIDCSKEPVTYFRRFAADARDRTETAMTQAHVFTVCRLALETSVDDSAVIRRQTPASRSRRLRDR